MFCHAGLCKALRAARPDEPVHPSWIVYVQALDERDAMGQRISQLKDRRDFQALSSMGALLEGASHWRRRADRLFLGGLLLQLYWPWPMMDLWALVRGHRPRQLTKGILAAFLREIRAAYANVRVVDGCLQHGVQAGGAAVVWGDGWGGEAGRGAVEARENHNFPFVGRFPWCLLYDRVVRERRT